MTDTTEILLDGGEVYELDTAEAFEFALFWHRRLEFLRSFGADERDELADERAHDLVSAFCAGMITARRQAFIAWGACYEEEREATAAELRACGFILPGITDETEIDLTSAVARPHKHGWRLSPQVSDMIIKPCVPFVYNVHGETSVEPEPVCEHEYSVVGDKLGGWRSGDGRSFVVKCKRCGRMSTIETLSTMTPAKGTRVVIEGGGE